MYPHPTHYTQPHYSRGMATPERQSPDISPRARAYSGPLRPELSCAIQPGQGYNNKVARICKETLKGKLYIHKLNMNWEHFGLSYTKNFMRKLLE